MKKFASLLIISVTILLLVGCGDTAINTTNNQSVNNTLSVSNVNVVNNTQQKAKKDETKKEYTPSAQGEFGHIYKTEQYKNLDGSNPVINVKNIIIKDNGIVVQIDAPTQPIMQYALDKFISFNALDKYGDSVDVGDIKLQSGSADGVECEFIVSSKNASNAEWMEIGPYKLQGQTPTYKITK